MIATITRTDPTFLYPQSRQFPFDEVCEQIVRALEERNWEVPGIDVVFDVYGTGADKYRLVRRITGPDFVLRFGRPQGNLGRWNDTAAISEINIPQQELHVYDDESGPTYYVYCGKNWAAHRDAFENRIKVNSKLRGGARIYLRYSGRGGRMERSSQLVHDSDLGREWLPTKRRDKQSFRTADVFEHFTMWLQDNVLALIVSQPTAGEKVDYFQETVTPFPADIGPIFCFGEHRDAQRVRAGQADINRLEPDERYGLMGNMPRLLPLGVRSLGVVPEIAYDGFVWCGLGDVSGDTDIATLEVHGQYRHTDRERFVFRISPNRADDVYVADNAAYEQYRSELLGRIIPRVYFTDEEVDDAQRERARTIIPITEYDGSFEQPIVLFNREIDLDEVELVSGPWPECQYVRIIAERSPEARQLLENAMAARSTYHAEFSKLNQAAFDREVEKLAEYFDGDERLVAAAEEYTQRTFRRTKLGPRFIERIVSAAGESRELGLF